VSLEDSKATHRDRADSASIFSEALETLLC
jgi:hypothetical protein